MDLASLIALFTSAKNAQGTPGVAKPAGHLQALANPGIDLATGLPLTSQTLRGNVIDPYQMGSLPMADYSGYDFGRAGTYNPVRTPPR